MPYLRNKRTGETVFVPDGPQQVAAPNPLKVQGARAGVESTQVGTQGKVLDNTITKATLKDVVRKTKAEADKAEADAKAAQDAARGFAKPDSVRRATLSDRMTALKNLETVLADLEGQYVRNFQGQKPSRGFGLAELLPEWASGTNQKFNSTALRAGPFIQSILGLGSKEADAAAEYEKKVMPFIPRAGGLGSGFIPNPEHDETTESKLKMMNDFLNQQRSATYVNLGKPAPRPRRSALDRQAPKKQQSRVRIIGDAD